MSIKRKFNKARVEVAEQVITDHLSVTELLHSKTDSKLEGKKASCPFHDDISPSFFVDEDRQIWKCQSCGRGGGYIRLYTEIANVLDGRFLDYYTAIDRIIKEFDLTNYLSFNSVFVTIKEINNHPVEVRSTRKPSRISQGNSLWDINKSLRKEGDIESICSFIYDLQRQLDFDVVKLKFEEVQETSIDELAGIE